MLIFCNSLPESNLLKGEAEVVYEKHAKDSKHYNDRDENGQIPQKNERTKDKKQHTKRRYEKEFRKQEIIRYIGRKVVNKPTVLLQSSLSHVIFTPSSLTITYFPSHLTFFLISPFFCNVLHFSCSFSFFYFAFANFTLFSSRSLADQPPNNQNSRSDLGINRPNFLWRIARVFSRRFSSEFKFPSLYNH